MFCTKCGREIPDNTICPCSQEQQAAPQQQQPQQQFQQQPPQQQQFQQQQQQFQQQPPQQQFQQQQYQQPQQQYQPPYNAPPAVPADNRKLFSMLAYIPVCFLIGMFSQNTKNDPRVRFHVGQGIMLTILWGAMQIFTIIINVVLAFAWTTVRLSLWRGYYRAMHPGAIAIVAILWIITWGGTIALALMSILNINKNQDKPLPIIGGMAFYK